MSFKILVVVAVIVSASRCQSDSYLKDAEGYCSTLGDTFSCGKYNFLRYIDIASDNGVLVTNVTTSPVQLVKIQGGDENAETFFPEAGKSLEDENEFSKFLKFVQRRADRFLRMQGISVPIPTWFNIVDQDDQTNSFGTARKSPKKKGIISLLTLFGVFKVKVLAGLILLGIFFIKKVILLSALLLPSLLHNLKMSCKHMVPYHAPHTGGHTVEEYHDDSSYYGNYGGSSGYSGGKDWERRYRAKAGFVNQGAANQMNA